jgi:hypothetical protein
MPWIPEEHMADVHIIRQDYARALAAYDAHPGDYGAVAALNEAGDRRERAMRSLARDDHASVRHIAAMFRCSKTVVRDALAGEGL